MAQTYSQFRPTQYDRNIELGGRAGWLVLPVSRNRDSDTLANANWESVSRELDSKRLEYEKHSFNHWANGWFEIILVKPTRKAQKYASELETRLASCGILDEELYSSMQWVETFETFDKCTRLDLARYVETRYELKLFATPDFIRADAILADWLEALEGLGIVDRISEGPDSLWRVFRGIVDDMNRSEFAAFIRRLKTEYKKRLASESQAS
jgi:hypothetical protein